MNAPTDRIIGFGDFVVDLQKRLLLKSGEPIPLIPKAFDLLAYLAENSGRVIDKNELMSAIWPDTVVEESNLSQNISILRRTLGEKRSENLFIATVPGRGYKFVADVRIKSDTADEQEIEPPLPSLNPAVHQVSAPTNRYRRLIAASLVLVVVILVLGSIYFFYSEPAASNGGPIRSIAVLPFRPVDFDQSDQILEIGMTDTLIMKLSENADIVVRPLSSVRQFSSVDQDALEAGRRLGVEAVLEGTLQRVGETVRVNVRLLRTEDGRSLWGATYDEKIADIFGLQDAIAQKAAGALKVRLKDGRKAYTLNIDAYQLYVKAALAY